MESIFIYSGEIYRIDGVNPDDSTYFYGERLTGKLEPTEDYRLFKFSDLLESHADAIVQARTLTDYHHPGDT